MHRGNGSPAAAIRPRIFADLKASSGAYTTYIQRESVSAETINNEFSDFVPCERNYNKITLSLSLSLSYRKILSVYMYLSMR